MVRGLSQLASKAKPTAFHHMLATLGKQGRLMRLYTQNVDGIDTSLAPLATSVPLASKGPWPRTIQLHGGLEKMVCSKCNHLADFQPGLFDGPTPPLCTQCSETDKIRTDHAGKRSHGIGRLRPRIVLYNEANPDDEAIGAVVSSDLRARPDAVVVVGTSMKIPGVRRIVREMCAVVRARRDGLAVWVNHDPPPVGKEFEDCWDLIVKGSSDDVASFAKLRRWDEDGIDVKHCTDSEAERAMQAKNFQVLIASSQNPTSTSMPTPAASPGPKPLQSQSKLNFSRLQSVEIPAQNSGSLKAIPDQVKPTNAYSKTKSKALAGKRSKPRPSDTSGDAKIKITYKVTKAMRVPLESVKRKPSLSLADADQLHRPPEVAQNNGSVSTVSDLASLKVKRSISPQDLELLGPTKVVLAPLTSTNRQSAVGMGCPSGRLPTGMELLLH
ncbi:MAG: hypothetical protein Q9209_003307 [Squamulea sp. 1 TL-2023]